MSLVIVAGSQDAPEFAVIDFSVPGSPVNVLTAPPFTAGCVVDCDGTLAVVGDFNGGEVAIYDISNPAVPALLGTVSTPVSRLATISIDGTHVLVGDGSGDGLVLVDVSNPSAPLVVSTINTGLSSISAVALKGAYAVATGVYALTFVVVDYTNPSHPTQVQFVPGTAGVHFGNSPTCDLDGTHAALADSGSGNVYLFDISGGTPSLLGQYASTQSGISSLSISGNFVAAASTNDFTMSLIDFTNPGSPSGADTATKLGGGAIVRLSGSNVAAGATNGVDVTLFARVGITATAQGIDDTTIGPLGTFGMTSFIPATPVATVAVSPSSLAFGPVLVLKPSEPQSLTVKNMGTEPLHVTVAQPAANEYHVSPSGNLQDIAPNHSTVLHVTFTPSAVQSYPSELNLTTNDPTKAFLSIPLSGSGGYPHAVVPGPLAFGDVAVCLSHTLGATIGNTGPVSLHMSSIVATGPGFGASPGLLTVPAGGNASIHVTFNPAMVGALNGSLGFKTDDPTTPNAGVALSGTGTPEPPPAISVTPVAIDFGAVPLQYYAGIAVTVANTGPCEDLDVTLTVSGAAFVLKAGDLTTLTPGNLPITDTVSASTSNTYTVVFVPVSTGTASGTLTIVSNDPAHPSVKVALTGIGVTASPAAIQLILDRSGSMATTITGGTRMTALQSAVSMFAELVIPGTGFSMGSVQFDTTDAILTPLANFDATQQSAIIAGANALSPRFFTCIGGGLQLGQTGLAASAEPRKVAIVFTDGYENTDPMIATVEPGVISAGIEVYAVGLGDPAYLSVAALNQLAASSNGKFFQTTDPLVLRKQFVEILADAFRQNLAADPILDLQQGVSVTVPVNITTCESRISFVLLWEDPSAQVQFSVRAPDGTVFSSASAAANRLVRYVERPGYRFLQIALPPGPNHAIGPRQLGEWRMLIDPVFVAGGSTRAATSVLVEGELQIEATITATTVGAPMSVIAQVTHAGVVLGDAKVTLKLTSPLTSLASLSTPIVRQRAAAADTHLIPPNLQILTKTHTSQHQAQFERRAYFATLPVPEIDGVYTVEVSATGQACGGAFERYWSGSTLVAPRDRRPPRGGNDRKS
ncbi:choice-of-anchor D domain-containing protein [Caballeronia sordidicola]|uniref:choice-of-anchor D domain-containing protein n=1 Tax=Caballeronia sordidicola TaxID=196367 RepID=UPI0004D038A2|nr:choice-of-anchor D domain-containing protein [Caballeronia sordidicola]